MANFRKPPGVDLAGYDPKENKQVLTVARYATVALWGGGPPGNEKLKVELSDPLIAAVVEQPRKGDLRIFRVTGKRLGSAKLEAKVSAGGVWAAMQIEVVQSRGKRIVVYIDSQTLEAFDSGKLVYRFICVTGDSSHPTDRGHFKVTRREHPYISKTYNVPMDYALFFTADGKAIHQYHGTLPVATVRFLKSKVSDYLGSHGCVRLSEEDASALFVWAPLGTPVEVK